NADTAFYSKTYSVKPDSVQNVEVTFNTAPLMFNNKLRISLSGARNEYYDFNNHIERQFYVSRDKEKPKLTVTSDGSEIVTGDIISAKPEIVFQMTDNSPLPLSDTSYFYILHNGNELSYKNDSVSFSYSNYPDSKAEAVWHPFLQNGKHRLDVLARDASGNYSDSAVYTVSFYVNNKNDISKVFNYPNPCSGETHFTFELTGENLPEECTIKIFTVAGRKVREVSVSPAALRFGFNKIFYDCRDQDGNSLANGVYFYKIIVKNKNITKSVTQKLAIVR
ncbi:MAG: T9SS type A sorting domain-containing protein, partial [Bacteroidota bacterium]